ncbi:LacI family DNA-binding transcriptional regulator [Ferroacidibacillus organovorans]|uniref:HTH lacI-type domain-containing protein n=1 Tax=Ferroacidibacillus organovorans TaxID=1765683 RepID=A0A124IWE1_9BACL|nr:LacI family DNA-binding transcriptional regulator [Ferroacidibacillus organovorans]KUO97099.1 hypothetical protein ATW55_12365 [Ferroacidibacillus organovorans]
MSSKRITIQDVARAANVSVTTVSRFLNARYEAMSKETKLRIEQVIEELNYQPNALAQGLKGNRSRMIAIVVVKLSYPFCVSLIRALSNTLTPAGYNVVVCETEGDPKREADVLKTLLGQQIDAVVIQTNGDNLAELETISKSVPVILVDRKFMLSHATHVLTDNYEASLEMTNHLYAEGYQEVFYITETPNAISTRSERMQGYLDSSLRCHRPPHVAIVRRGDDTSMRLVVERIKESVSKGSVALYTANALIFHEIYPLLHHVGWTAPKKLGLATFDEPDWINLISPSLTRVRQPVSEMGTWIANLLLQQFKTGYEQPAEMHVEILPSELIKGESTRLGREDGTASDTL